MNFLKKIFNKDDGQIDTFEKFWKWFASNEKSFHKAVKNEEDIEVHFFDKISQQLDAIHSGFYFLTGMFDKSTVELIISVEGSVKNFVFAENLVACSPKLKGWKFTALKPPMSEELSISAYDFEFNNNNIFFYENENAEFPDEIDVTVVHDDFTEANSQNIINGVYIYLDNYLGELDFAQKIDKIDFKEKNKAEKELIPIHKLKAFLHWRETEFVEKYDGIRYNTEDDEHTLYESELENGKPVIAIVNAELLKWDGKASHPWFMALTINYKGSQENGMPSDEDAETMNEIQEEILEKLKDSEGYLNIGRETADNVREIFFACKEFRKPSLIVNEIINKYDEVFDMNYEIVKDKYWQTLSKFN